MIIGITGTLGAGKGAVVSFLTRSPYSFAHFSVRDFLTTLIERRGLPVNRDSMVLVANELRSEHSPSYLVEQLLTEARAKPGIQDFIIESIRTEGEVTALRKLAPGAFKLFAVDADPELRYSRIVQRASATDSVDFETFVANEQREMRSEDPAKQNLGRTMELADVRFKNDGTLEELHAQVERALASQAPKQ